MVIDPSCCERFSAALIWSAPSAVGNFNTVSVAILRLLRAFLTTGTGRAGGGCGREGRPTRPRSSPLRLPGAGGGLPRRNLPPDPPRPSDPGQEGTDQAHELPGRAVVDRVARPGHDDEPAAGQ